MARNSSGLSKRSLIRGRHWQKSVQLARQVRKKQLNVAPEASRVYAGEIPGGSTRVSVAIPIGGCSAQGAVCRQSLSMCSAVRTRNITRPRRGLARCGQPPIHHRPPNRRLDWRSCMVMVLDSDIEAKHCEFRVILTLCAMIQRALALHSSLRGTDLPPLNDLHNRPKLVPLAAGDRLRLTQLSWISLLAVREHEIIATAASDTDSESSEFR